MLRTTSFFARLSGMVSLLFAAPLAVAFAAVPDTRGADTLGSLLLTVIYFIDRYLVPLIFALAFIVFLWGIYSTFIANAANEEKRQEGQKILIYGMLGFFIMVSLWGLVNVLVGTFGFYGDNRPDLPIFGAPSSATDSGNPFGGSSSGGSSGNSSSGGSSAGSNSDPKSAADCDPGYSYVPTYGINSEPACIKNSNTSSSGGNNNNPINSSDCDPGYTFVLNYGNTGEAACIKNSAPVTR